MCKLVSISLVLVNSFVGISAEISSTQCINLVARFDANGNGRIDVEERKGYVRELARERRNAANAQAAKRAAQGGLKLEDLKPRGPTRAQIIAHDANRDSRLDPDERARLDAALREELAQRFKRADANGDGVLNREETQALRRMTGP
jgi:Ca2+-binding EF-hand superfamily protein